MLRLNATFCSFKRVHQQHGDGHGAHPTRDGGDVTGNLLDAFKVDIATQFAFLVAIILASVIWRVYVYQFYLSSKFFF